MDDYEEYEDHEQCDHESETRATAYEIVHCLHDLEPVVHLTLSYAEVSLIAMALEKYVPVETENARLQFLKADDDDFKESLTCIAGFGEAAKAQWLEMEAIMDEPMANWIDWNEWSNEMEAEA